MRKRKKKENKHIPKKGTSKVRLLKQISIIGSTDDLDYSYLDKYVSKNMEIFYSKILFIRESLYKLTIFVFIVPIQNSLCLMFSFSRKRQGRN